MFISQSFKGAAAHNVKMRSMGEKRETLLATERSVFAPSRDCVWCLCQFEDHNGFPLQTIMECKWCEINSDCDRCLPIEDYRAPDPDDSLQTHLCTVHTHTTDTDETTTGEVTENPKISSRKHQEIYPKSHSKSMVSIPLKDHSHSRPTGRADVWYENEDAFPRDEETICICRDDDPSWGSSYVLPVECRYYLDFMLNGNYDSCEYFCEANDGMHHQDHLNGYHNKVRLPSEIYERDTDFAHFSSFILGATLTSKNSNIADRQVKQSLISDPNGEKGNKSEQSAAQNYKERNRNCIKNGVRHT